MRFFQMLKYMDELVAVGTGIATYVDHKDESILVDTLLTAIYSAAQDAWGDGANTLIDEQKVIDGIVQIVDGLEPLFRSH